MKKLAILTFLSRSFIRSQEQQVYVATSLSKKQDSEDAVYVIEAAHDGKKEKSYWTVLPGAEALITMLRENMEALGEKYEEDVDNAKNSKEACGEDEKVQFMWENHETVMKSLQRQRKKFIRSRIIDLVDYIGYEQYLEEIYVLGTGMIRGSWMLHGYHSLRADLKAEKDGQASYARGCCYVSELADDSAKKLACETAKEARAGLGAEPIVSGQYPVILKKLRDGRITGSVYSGILCRPD